MSWPSPSSGSQGSWKTRMVVGLLAFVLLIGIGYYNGRQNHPEIFDTEAIVTPDPNAPERPMAYPQIDLTEESSENASNDKAPSASPSAQAGSAAAADKAAGKAGAAPAADKTAGKAGAAPAADKTAVQNDKSAQNGKQEKVSPSENGEDGISDLVYDNSWPPPQNRPRTESTFWQRIPSMLMFLVLVCALIWISLRIIAPFSERLTGNPAPKKQINVIERKSLGPNKAIVLIEVADKRLVLGLTEKTITTLAELECPPPPAEPGKSETAKPAEEDGKTAPPRDLVKEVIAKHLSSLPSLK